MPLALKTEEPISDSARQDLPTQFTNYYRVSIPPEYQPGVHLLSRLVRERNQWSPVTQDLGQIRGMLADPRTPGGPNPPKDTSIDYPTEFLRRVTILMYGYALVGLTVMLRFTSPQGVQRRLWCTLTSALSYVAMLHYSIDRERVPWKLVVREEYETRKYWSVDIQQSGIRHTIDDLIQQTIPTLRDRLRARKHDPLPPTPTPRSSPKAKAATPKSRSRPNNYRRAEQDPYRDNKRPAPFPQAKSLPPAPRADPRPKDGKRA